MRFLHSADLHIGSLRGLKGVSNEEKLARHEATLRAIFRIAKEQRVDYIVIAGDVFDRKDVRPRERDILVRVLAENPEIPVLMINGNHDLLEEGYTSLHFLTLLQGSGKLKNLYLAECKPRILEFDDAIFFLIPFTGLGDRNYRKIIERMLRKFVERVARKSPIVVVGHEMLRDCSDDSGWSPSSGLRLPQKLPFPGIAYWAMGDIHRCQSVGLPNAWYPGSPAQHRFSEKADKGVLLVDGARPNDPVHLPITNRAIRQLVTVEAHTIEDIEQLNVGHNKEAWVRLQTTRVVREKLVKAGVKIPDNAVQRESIAHDSDGIMQQVIEKRDPIAMVGKWLQNNLDFSPEDAATSEILARNLQ